MTFTDLKEELITTCFLKDTENLKQVHLLLQEESKVIMVQPPIRAIFHCQDFRSALRLLEKWKVLSPDRVDVLAKLAEWTGCHPLMVQEKLDQYKKLCLTPTSEMEMAMVAQQEGCTTMTSEKSGHRIFESNKNKADADFKLPGSFSDVLHQYKLFHVIMHWGKVTLNLVLKWSLDYQKKVDVTLYEIVIEKGCEKSFTEHQIKILKAVVTIDSLDISITFLLLLHIGGLSKSDDPVWENSHSLEYNLKMVKFHRNNSCHPCDSMTEKDTVMKINELHKLYENILSEAGNKFLIDEDIVKKKIEEITEGVYSISEKIRETFDPNNNQHVQNFCKELKSLKDKINREVIEEAQAKLQEVNCSSCLLQLVSWTPHDYSAKPSKLYIPNEYQLNENSTTFQDTIVNEILDSKINNVKKQSFWIVCGERGSGKTMLCNYLIEKSTIQNTFSRQTKYSFIFYCQEVDYKYDSLDAMIKSIFHDIYTYNGLSFSYFMEILTSVPILVVIDGYTESHIKLVRDTVTCSNISAVITTRPGSQDEIKNLLMYKAKINYVNIKMLKNESMEKIVFNVLTIMGHPNQFNALTTKINEEMERLGTWLKYPLGILIMAVLWIHREIDATTNTCIIQRHFFKHMVNRFKDGVYKFNLCSTMDKVNEKYNDIIEKCKVIFEKSDGVELKKQALEILQKMCKVNHLPEEYTLSSFFDCKREIQGLEACKIRTLPCRLTINVVKESDGTQDSCTQSNISYNSHNAVKLVNSIPIDRNINNLLKVVFESNNNEIVAAAVASRINAKNCRIKEGYLEALPAVFNFIQPTEVIFETSKDPNTVPHLLQSIKFVSERSIISRIYLYFEYNYNYPNSGIDNKFIELLAENQECRLLQFMGCLTLFGLSLLPKWVERLLLRITENQISNLNENLPRLHNLNLLAVVLDLSKSRPRPESVDSINFRYTNRKLNLQIAADITDEEAIYAAKVIVKLCPRGIKSLNEIQFKETHLTSAGIISCMEELHINDIVTQKIIFRTTEIISEEETTNMRLLAFTYNMKPLEIIQLP